MKVEIKRNQKRTFGSLMEQEFFVVEDQNDVFMKYNSSSAVRLSNGILSSIPSSKKATKVVIEEIKAREIGE